MDKKECKHGATWDNYWEKIDGHMYTMCGSCYQPIKKIKKKKKRR